MDAARRLIVLCLAAMASVSCAKSIAAPEVELRPVVVTPGQRSSWQSSLMHRYGNYVNGDMETEGKFMDIMENAVELQTYKRIVEVLEEEVIRHGGEGVSDPAGYALHAPLSLSGTGRDLTGWAARLALLGTEEKLSADRVVQDFTDEIFRLLGDTGGNEEEGQDFSIPDKQEILLEDVEESILLVAIAAINRAREAYAEISEEEMEFFLKKSSPALAELISQNNISETLKTEEGKPDFLKISRKLKLKPLTEAMRVLAELASPEMMERYEKLSAQGEPAQTFDIDQRFRGDFVYAQQTPIGLVLIGGRGKNIYGGDAAVIIDLGGDDVYTGNAGASIYEIENTAIAEVTSPLGVIVDLAGDDRYISTRFASMGAGFWGLGLLVDQGGNDIYVGHTVSQGAGFMGIGCLVDMAGDDTYTTQHMGQGAALFGAGLLFDAEGNDLFSGAKFAQGIAGPGGTGELVDLQGDDQYVVGGQFGSGYGTRKIYQGYGQGLGWGFRGHAGGGIGVLYDQGGNDIYEAGSFAQGTGYYFGLGLMHDVAGDDKYWGSRYCQGAAAHQAVGILLDDAGNDVYAGQIAASQGAAWDVAVAGFYDLAGDDVYVGSDLSLGGAEQNGIALFYEGGGKDTYMTPLKKTLGYGGRTEYAGGRNAANIGIFLDRGGATDRYETKIWDNDAFTVQDNIGIFVDE